MGNRTFIVGHKNPDTDAVTSAISLSYLKNKMGFLTEPRVLGNINKETAFVLKKFKIEKPEFLNDVKVQISDINYDKKIMCMENESIYDVYSYMIRNGYTGVPIVKENKKFVGYVSLKEIAASFITGKFDTINASFDNILKVIKGEEVLRFNEKIEGKAFTFVHSNKEIKNVNLDNYNIVITGADEDVLKASISSKVKLIVIVNNQKISEEVLSLAKTKKVNIIKTHLHAFNASKLIGLSCDVKTIIRDNTPVTFDENDYLTDFLEVSNKLRHTNYPIVDKKGICGGMLRLVDINNHSKKTVILVDHNDIKQSVNGLNEAELLEIVDHHALGNLTTNAPISFRNMTVGSTNTIVYHLFKEAGVSIPKDIAGVMLSGILSDTLILKSPTTTMQDKKVAESLAKTAGLDIEEYGMEMLKAGSSLKGLSMEDIIFGDYKEFTASGRSFGIGQVLTLDYDKILEEKDEYIKYLDKECKIRNFELIALFITDIVNNGSYVLFSSNADKIMSLAYNIENIEEGTYLDGVISRKKQMVPNIMQEIENMN